MTHPTTSKAYKDLTKSKRGKTHFDFAIGNSIAETKYIIQQLMFPGIKV